MSDYDDLVLSLGGLIAYYPLDETSGTTAVDASGNGHHGTWTGAAQGAPTTIPAEDPGAAASFSWPPVKRIALPASLALAPGDDFSFVSWVRVPEEAFDGLHMHPDDPGAMNRPLFTVGNLDDPNRCTAHLPNLAEDADGAASFDYGSTGTGRTYGPNLLEQNLTDRNVFVAAVANLAANTRRIFVQGLEAGADLTATAGPSVILSGGSIGWWAGTGKREEQFVGAQAGVGFFRRALAASEVRRLFCVGSPRDCGGFGIGRVPI